MIKPLRTSDKIVRPFKTFKTWEYNTTDESDVILLEHMYFTSTEGGLVGEPDYITKVQIKHQWSQYLSEIGIEFIERIELGVNYIDVVTKDDNVTLAIYKEGSPDNHLLYENGYGASPEKSEPRNGEFEIKVKYGKKIDGAFYPRGHRKHNPDKEPMNNDGSYFRVVYNTIKHLFYNDYFVNHYDHNQKRELNVKNPLMLFGVESAEYHDPTVIEDIDTSEYYTNRRIERRVLTDDIKVLEISRRNFGEKIRPKSLKIRDYSSEFEVIEIVDDGYTNLITKEATFDNVHRVGITWAERVEALQDTTSFDPRDFSFGEKLKSSGVYFLTGAPMKYNELSESQSGTAYLKKYDKKTDSFRIIRSFSCPFSQNGLALEQRHDHNNLLLKEMKDVLLSKDYSLNDNFGSAIELTDDFCAIGASRAHIRGESSQSPTGYLFVYEKNKGGNENWGIINVLEGLPGSGFGTSVSISGDLMAVGSPTIKGTSGIVYIFKKSKRTKNSAWNRVTNVTDGYSFNETKKQFQPTETDATELQNKNKSTTRWKVESVIPDGSILNCFSQVGDFNLSGSIGEPSCECDLETFAGDELISSGKIPKNNNEDFDAGYEPHEYSDTPEQSLNDTTWVFDSYVKIESNDESILFGEEVKLIGNRLYVTTPSSKNQICYVFERRINDCNKVVWELLYEIEKNGILDKNSNIYTTFDLPNRKNMVDFPFDYNDAEKHRFGHSIDANDQYLVIGDPYDRTYSVDDLTYEAGSSYVFDVSKSDKINLSEKLYGEKTTENKFSSRFGNSVSILESDILIGSYCIDSSDISADNDELIISDYYMGTDNLRDDSYLLNGEHINAIEGEVYYFRFFRDENESYRLMKKTKMNKQKNSVRRQYGYSVSLSSDYMFVGLPVIGNFPFTELITFDNESISIERELKHNPHEPSYRQPLFGYYDKLNEVNLQNEQKNVTGNVIAYRTDSVREVRNHQVGNIFYKNGIIVITKTENHLKNILSGSFREGFEIEFLGTHTIYEKEILCTIDPNEFNVSTNPTALKCEDIIYDVNGDGKFDLVDLILIYKFLMGHSKSSYLFDEIFPDEEVPGGISIEQDMNWPNADILMSESEDAILMFFEKEADNLPEQEYEKSIPMLNKLKDNGHFDVNDDGTSGSADAKLIIRYFKGNLGQDLIRGLVTKRSKRRVPSDIVDFLDRRTGKNNGVELIKDFEKYTSLERLMRVGKSHDALCPYVTTIGLYSGLELVAVAKLAKPVKVTPSYPINFLIKYDA